MPKNRGRVKSVLDRSNFSGAMERYPSMDQEIFPVRDPTHLHRRDQRFSHLRLKQVRQPFPRVTSTMVRHRLQKQLSAALLRCSLIHIEQPRLTASLGQQEPHAGCCLLISSYGSYPLQTASPPGMSSFSLRPQFFPNSCGESQREI